MRCLFTRLFSITFFLHLCFHSQAQDKKTILPLLLKNAKKIGLSVKEIEEAVVTRVYTDDKTGITYAYLLQTHGGIEVYNSIVTLAFRDNMLAYSSGAFIKNIESKAGSSRSSIQPLDAVKRSMEHLHLRTKGVLQVRTDHFADEKKYTVAADSIARQDIEVKQYWLPSEDRKQLVLVWNVNIDDLYSDDWWLVSVNATNGQVIQKYNFTRYENTGANDENCYDNTEVQKSLVQWPVNSLVKDAARREINKSQNNRADFFAPVVASYQIIPYPAASPDVRSADLVVDPWLTFGVGNPATTLAWHSTATTDYRITRGNNVFAYLGTRPTDAPNAQYNWPDTSTLPGARLFFLQIPNYTYQPNDSVRRENKKFAIDNLFYWTNMLHDVTYQYGFTEPAGNFQASNLARGGAENDPVLAQAQDGHGFNNANFTTPFDGGSGRMRMYLYKTGGVQFTMEETFGTVRYPAVDNLCDAPNKIWQTSPVAGEVVLVNDDAFGITHFGCTPPANNISGKIALVDLTALYICNDFALVAKNCQNAGAIGVIVYSIDENLYGIGGTDTSVHIPLIVVAASTGNHILERLAANETVLASMSSDYRDASLDNCIISHEYMHGVTSRLTGGHAGCLANNEQAGEGWSDYLGLMMTTDWSTTTLADYQTPRPIANYAISQPASGPGLRGIPYSTDMTVNPLTYANVADNTEAHFIGQIWCSALWDMTWNIILQNGTISPGFKTNTGTGGNIVAMNLVMTALKLQTCYPGLLDARDAILAADSILYNKQYNCAIWTAFARRGMGYNAKQGGSNNALDQVAGYALPASVISIADSVVYTDATITVTHSVTPSCVPLTSYTLRDTIPKGFTYVSSLPSGTLVSDSILVFPATNFAANETKNFSITLTATGPGCKPDTVINDDRDGNTLGGFTENNFPFGSPEWTPAPNGHTGNGWQALNAEYFTEIRLTSVPTAGSPGKGNSLLSFWHNYDIEFQYDAAVVQYSLNGTNWLDAGPYMIKNPYNTTLIGVVLGRGVKAFSGNSGGFQQTVIDLSSFGTTPLQIRFFLTSDDVAAVNGWIVDDILRINSCGGRLRSGLFSGAGSFADAQSMTMLHILPLSTLPLSLLSFEAVATGSVDALNWKTATEVNVKEFEVQFSTDNRQWTTIATVPAQNGSSNEYASTNNNPVIGANYYRLKMKDIDGSFTYSPVRIIRRKSNEELFSIIPNPASQNANFYFSKELNVSGLNIYDGTGRLVKQVRLARGSSQQTIDVRSLSAGVYIAEVITAQGKKTLRFVVR